MKDKGKVYQAGTPSNEIEKNKRDNKDDSDRNDSSSGEETSFLVARKLCPNNENEKGMIGIQQGPLV